MSYCQICNKEFITKRKTDKFCHNMHFKFCVVCGKKYEVKCDKFFAKRYAEATLKGESAKIYVIDYDDFIKIGIRQSDRRFSTLRPKYTKRGKLLFEFELPTQKAIDLEYQIAITLPKSKEHIQGKGKTECYKKESLQDFLKMLQVAKSK